MLIQRQAALSVRLSRNLQLAMLSTRSRRQINPDSSPGWYMQQVRVPQALAVILRPITFLEHVTNIEQAHLLESLQRCLELRDKYMLKSCQRIGDDPRDYDGHFRPLADEHADVCETRPDVAIDAVKDRPQLNLFEKWNIYPKPPPPHWHWKDSETVVGLDDTNRHTNRLGRNEISLDDWTIPGEHHGWSFGIDIKGVFQVYDDNEGTPHKSSVLLY